MCLHCTAVSKFGVIAQTAEENEFALEAEVDEERAGVLWWWEQEEAEPVAEMQFHSSAVGFTSKHQGVAEWEGFVVALCLTFQLVQKSVGEN